MSSLPDITVGPPPGPRAALSATTTYHVPPPSQTTADGHIGKLSPSDEAAGFNGINFVAKQLLNKACTSGLVQIMAVSNAGGLSNVGTVDVQPMVHQVDGQGKVTPHGIIHGLPYLRIQGGANAIIMDPQVGDIGVACYSSHDISVVKKTRKPSAPGSFRRFDYADGMYMYSILGAAANQYIQFSTGGITVTTPGTFTVNAQNIDLNGSVQAWIAAPNILIDGIMSQGTGPNGGTATLLGPITVIHDLTAQGTSVHLHLHSGVQTGSGDTGPPV